MGMAGVVDGTDRGMWAASAARFAPDRDPLARPRTGRDNYVIRVVVAGLPENVCE